MQQKLQSSIAWSLMSSEITSYKNTLQNITVNDYPYISVYMQSIHSYFEKIILFFMYDY